MEELENKYIDLILKRCVNFDQAKSLMIHCELKEHVRFAEKMKKRANELGIFDVCIHAEDHDEIHEYLKNTDVDDIKINPLIDRTDWEKYALKGGALVFLNSNVPGLMDDIPEEKINKMVDERLKTVPYYKSNASKYAFPWCIVTLPNERWAKSIFGDVENAYDKLFLNIMKMCMVDRDDPVQAWSEHIVHNNCYKDILNELDISQVRFTNSLGTDFTVGIPKGNIWLNLDKTDAHGGMVITNMPSYEIFTTPDYRMTNGIVYSSRPLLYNNAIIEDFYFVFKDGKVVECHAKKGDKVLNQLVFEHENADYIGEIALVPADSPISNTGLVFNTTLYDENASCHFALGRGFARSFPGYEHLSEAELVSRGYNSSTVHVDVMFGTPDLEAAALTPHGKKLIFKNGNFNI